MSVVAAQVRQRHVHSPRVRRLARDLGVGLDQLAPTGRLGRATEDDVRRRAEVGPAAATPALAPVPDVVVGGGAQVLTSVVEIDVTGLTVLTARVVEAAARTLTSSAWWHGEGSCPPVTVAARVGARTVALPDVGDLTVDGLARRLAGPAVDVDRRHLDGRLLLVRDDGDTGLLHRTPALADPLGAVLLLGATSRRPAVVARGDDEVIAVRTFAHLSLAHTLAWADEDSASAFLRLVRARLEP